MSRIQTKVIAFISDFFLRFRSTEHTFMVITAVIIGLIGGFGAVGIQEAIKFFQELFWGKWEVTAEYISGLPWTIKIGAPLIGSLIVGLIIQFYAKEAKGHGVPEVMEAIALRNGIIRPRVVLAKLLASSIYIGSGGSVGREGPVIQIGSAVGSTIGQFLRVNPKRMKIFVACGAASGIAAAFNAPVAGALFAVEVILGDFGVAQFSPIVISSVVATVVSRHFLGDFPAFEVPKYELVSPFELVPYVFVGLGAGIVALAFIRTLYWFEDAFEKMPVPQVVQTLIGGLGIGIIGMYFPQIYGVGYSTMNFALYGKLTWQIMGLLILIKIISTSISLGSGGSGGVFAPSLFLGAMTGGFLGSFVHQIFPGMSATAGAYALVGMGAVVAGTTHAPITAILILFELTNDYKIILPLMISTIIASLLTTKIQKESIYTLKLIRRGIDIFKGQEINILRSIKVQDAISPQITKVKANANFQEILATIADSNNSECFVENLKGELIGVIPMRNIRKVILDRDYLENILIGLDIMDENVPFVSKNDTLDHAMKLFSQCEIEELPVISSVDNKTLVGTITRKSVIDIYNRELNRRNMAQELSSSVKLLEKNKEIEFLPGTKIVQIPIPGDFAGKSIRELNIRRRFGVEILVILRNEGGIRQQIMPHSDYIFTASDYMIVMGNEKEIKAIQHL
ncbi:MAG: chloride channel protein [Calditrichia bacterium]